MAVPEELPEGWLQKLWATEGRMKWAARAVVVSVVVLSPLFGLVALGAAIKTCDKGESAAPLVPGPAPALSAPLAPSAPRAASSASTVDAAIASSGIVSPNGTQHKDSDSDNRDLDDAHWAKLRDALKGDANQHVRTVSSVANDAEASRLARQLARAIVAAEWSIEAAGATWLPDSKGPNGPDWPVGLFVFTRDPNSPSKAAIALAVGLVGAGLTRVSMAADGTLPLTDCSVLVAHAKANP
jgi:hypothetical protein